MTYKDFSQILSQAKINKRRRRLAVACAGESHIIEAVAQAASDDVIEPILIGDSEEIRRAIAESGQTIPEAWIVHAPDRAAAAAMAVKMVRDNKADFIMKGLLETADMLRAVLDKECGIGTGGMLSHISITHIPAYHKLLVITDAGMIIQPDLQQKKHIIRNAVRALRALGYEQPKVAVLAAIEHVNHKMPESVDAALIKESWMAGDIPDCILEGPIAMDLALNAEAATIKGYKSPVVGDADIIIMPHMVTGNILSKALREFGDTTTVGIVVGAKVPIVLTSRGASVRTKYTSAVVASEMIGIL